MKFLVSYFCSKNKLLEIPCKLMQRHEFLLTTIQGQNKMLLLVEITMNILLTAFLG